MGFIYYIFPPIEINFEEGPVLSLNLEKSSYKSDCRTLTKKDIQKLSSKKVSLKKDSLNFIAEKINGQIYDSTCKKDKPLIIHFWETWCSSCIPEIFVLGDFAKKYENEFYFILASGGKKDKIVNYVQSNFSKVSPHVEFIHRNHLMDSIFREKVRPSTFVFNKEGKLIYKKRGLIRWKEDFFKKMRSRL